MPHHNITSQTLSDTVFHKALVEIAMAAGDEIMAVYNSDDFGIEIKEDDSPLTKADLAANAVIAIGLSDLTPNLPFVSEENVTQRDGLKPGELYWLVDPLDGTKEFIKRNGDFTVNIALIMGSEPIFGVVFAPVKNLTYWGGKDIGAWRFDGSETTQISVKTMGDNPRIVASVNHLNDATKQFHNRYPSAEIVQVGSSIKICMIADGQADLYPRLSPTCEWDTAAADAILRGAGGMLFQTDGTPLVYSKDDVLNPSFIGAAKSYSWE